MKVWNRPPGDFDPRCEAVVSATAFVLNSETLNGEIGSSCE